MKRKQILLIILLTFFTSMFGQNQIKGLIISEKGEPLAFANVVL